MFDLIFDKVELNMREIGYGDVLINKNMKFLIKTFYNILFDCEKFFVIKCSFAKYIYQLRIVKFYLNFLEILEIFLAAVFLSIVPDLATCMRID